MVKNSAFMGQSERVFGSINVIDGQLNSYLTVGIDDARTKLKLAFDIGIHDTIGKNFSLLASTVAMSVNDIVTFEAKPLIFLNYFATSHPNVDLAEKVLLTVANNLTVIFWEKMCECHFSTEFKDRENLILESAYLEMTKMPNFYTAGKYDRSGFTVGIVKKDSFIDRKPLCLEMYSLAYHLVESIQWLLSCKKLSSKRRLTYTKIPRFELVSLNRVLAQSGFSLKDQLPSENTTLDEALMGLIIIFVVFSLTST
ncbi:hypothetical protein CUMW_138220 [Citrus unshiu]|uniref:Uncharacterized protein n=1 Tax=Citrus unshiu TaxID=55188 RepID=A0A2H5PHX0_CITUN|nr:hypothetical protein CUMW_138220 [Citrus unshiu]